jgi:hypothetical protein
MAMAKKSTPAQKFKRLFDLWVHPGTPAAERANAERKLDAWLKQHGKTRADISAILAEAERDAAAAVASSPSSSDPRAAQSNPFTDPSYTAADLVQGVVEKYLAMDWHVSVIYSLWICYTHVYRQFEIAPRLLMTSEGPDSGKSTARKVASHLVYRPNEETIGTVAALRDYLDLGPGTLLLDELDYLHSDAQRELRRLWNLGHERRAKISLKVKGQRKLFNIHAPILGAGIGDILEATQESRTFKLFMEPYDQATKPARRYDSSDVEDLDAVYVFLAHWARSAKLNPDPDTTGMMRRFADNARGLLAVADSCGPAWVERARNALAVFAAQEKAAQPHFLIVKHGLAIFDAAGLDQATDVIGTTKFNRDLRQLDLPDARWSRYRGAGGMAQAHPITLHEQAALLRKKPNTIGSKTHWPPGPRVRGASLKVYCRGDFEISLRRHETAKECERPRLRLV